MAKELFANSLTKVVPFEQNGEFFHRKAKKYVDDNNYINALSYYRKAVEKDPDNIEYLMDLAEVFTEMGYFTESNQILFSVIQKSAESTDCYFGIGCNFLGLQEYEKAEECLKKYLELEEDGLYSEEAQDLLDVLQNQDIYYDLFNDIGPDKEKAYNIAIKGKDYLDKGDYKRAVKELERAVREEPGLVFARNNLALAYFCIGKLERAIDVSEEVLNDFPLNIHANCNIALFLHEKGDIEGSMQHIDSIMKLQLDDPEDIHKIAVTLCEMKQHERVNKLLKTLLQYKPYDTKVLHYMAVSLYNLRKYKAALKYWDKIEKISPNNTISSYYKHIVKALIKDDRSFKELPYNFQVPYDEVIRRVRKINDLLKLPSEDLHKKWQHGDSLASLLSWGLDLNDPLIKKAILNVVASFQDQKAERFLRDFILRRNEGEDQIKEALTLLKEMNALEPYIAYVDNNIVEVNVSIKKKKQLITDRILESIPMMAAADMESRFLKDFKEDLTTVWDCMLEYWTSEGMPKMRKPEGWAAALELYCFVKAGLPVNRRELAQSYDITYATLINNYNYIDRVMSGLKGGVTD